MSICLHLCNSNEYMPRKKCCRRVSISPVSEGFSPLGLRKRASQSITLNLDEFEAIRLADHLGLYHEEAAARMGVSRATFGRILSAARGAVADALVNGKRLQIAGIDAHMVIECSSCGETSCLCSKENQHCKHDTNINLIPQ